MNKYVCILQTIFAFYPQLINNQMITIDQMFANKIYLCYICHMTNNLSCDL
jgi:hypothetical protein